MSMKSHIKEAEEMIMDLKLKVLKKRRYLIDFSNKTWEVDVFEGNLKGLVIAQKLNLNLNKKRLKNRRG